MKPMVTRCRRHQLSPDGGSPETEGSAVMLVVLKRCLALVRLRGVSLELTRDAVDVARVLEQVLEVLELTLPDGAAERSWLQVGHVEAEHLRECERDRGLARDRVRVDARLHVLVR